MEQQKLKKILPAAVATAVLLLFILLSIMVYQMISISNARRQQELLNAQIVELRQKIESTENEIDKWCGEWELSEAERKARLLGYRYEDDKKA